MLVPSAWCLLSNILSSTSCPVHAASRAAFGEWVRDERESRARSVRRVRRARRVRRLSVLTWTELVICRLCNDRTPQVVRYLG